MGGPIRKAHGRPRWAGTAMLLSLLWSVLDPGPVAAFAQIVALKSVEAEPYTAALRAFSDTLAGRGQEVQLTEYLLKDGTADRVFAQIRERPPSLVLTLGSTATSLARDRVKQVPVVFCMVLNPEASGLVRSMQSSGNNLTGASLDVPVKLQFEALQGLLPAARRVGVLYNPGETSAVVEPARATAAAMGIELVAIPVHSAEQLPDVADGLAARKLDALWSVADSTVFASSRSVEYLLRRTLEAKLPFMGLSAEFVKAGALLALSVDYRDVGLQCGEQAIQVLAGHSPSALPITVPRKVTLYVNKNAAAAIGVKIPPHVLEQAVILK